jgi:hypothetical protein
MKKLIIAPLMLAALFAVTGGTQKSASAAPTAPEWGTCRWYCNSGVSFKDLSACRAVCGNECEQVC